MPARPDAANGVRLGEEVSGSAGGKARPQKTRIYLYRRNAQQYLGHQAVAQGCHIGI